MVAVSVTANDHAIAIVAGDQNYHGFHLRTTAGLASSSNIIETTMPSAASSCLDLRATPPCTAAHVTDSGRFCGKQAFCHVCVHSSNR